MRGRIGPNTDYVRRALCASAMGAMNIGETICKEMCDRMLLTGETIGIIGMGNIDLAVACMFIGTFNAKVLAVDPILSPTLAKLWAGIQNLRVEPLTELLVASDVVTIYIPLTNDTKGLIFYTELTMMKPTAILINAARYGIVDVDQPQMVENAFDKSKLRLTFPALAVFGI